MNIDTIKAEMAAAQAKQDAWEARQRAAEKELADRVKGEPDAANMPLAAAAISLIDRLTTDHAKQLADQQESREFEVERLKTAARANATIADAKIAELTDTLAKLTEQYQWLAANAIAVTFNTEHAQRMLQYAVPPLTATDSMDCPTVRGIEASMVLAARDERIIDRWLHKRGWKHNGTGTWTDPVTGESSHILNNAAAIQKARDLDPFKLILKRL